MSRQVDKKYHVVDNTKAGLNTAARKASEINQKYNITGKVAAGLNAGMNKVSEVLSLQHGKFCGK